MMEPKPIAEMSDDEIIEELKRLRARREQKREASRIKRSPTVGAKTRRGPRIEEMDLDDDALDELDIDDAALDELDEAKP
jgi:hypothetical protein